MHSTGSTHIFMRCVNCVSFCVHVCSRVHNRKISHTICMQSYDIGMDYIKDVVVVVVLCPVFNVFLSVVV